MTFTKVLSSPPRSLVIGNSVSWKLSLAEFPADEWTLSYALVNSSSRIVITAAADGKDHLVEISPATSSSYVAGEYEYQAIVTKSDESERYKISAGTFIVVADYASAADGHDYRTWVKKTLDYLEAMITGKVQKDRSTYTIAGRSLSAYTWDEVYQLRKDLRAEYNAEQRTKQRKSSSVHVRF